MQKEVEEAINLLIKAFKKHFDDFHGIYLYGIFTDDKEHQGEDIELVALFDAEDRSKREMIWPIVGKIETDLDIFIDLTPISQEEFKKNKDFYDEVTQTGVFFDGKGLKQKDIK